MVSGAFRRRTPEAQCTIRHGPTTHKKDLPERITEWSASDPTIHSFTDQLPLCFPRPICKRTMFAAAHGSWPIRHRAGLSEADAPLRLAKNKYGILVRVDKPIGLISSLVISRFRHMPLRRTCRFVARARHWCPVRREFHRGSSPPPPCH